MDKHITALGIIYIAFSILGIIAAVIVFLTVTGGGLMSGDPEAMAITAGVGISVSALIMVLSVPGILGGYGLLKKYNWARIVVLILGFLNLLNIPIGTAIGIYTIWVLFNDETVKMFTSQPAVAPESSAQV
jgi:hypothetical protein